ncbi:MAG: alpha-amylase, partial [Flaviaesturariibacter sp.]|nr:alpha-amylase [Flaviaesturariibacter sp.]
FGGNTVKTFSERRLKRSPLRDLAQMICDIYYVTMEGFYASNHLSPETLPQYLPYAEQWAFYISGFFLKAYGETVEGAAFLPEGLQEREMVLEIFLLERALKHLNIDLLAQSQRGAIALSLVAILLKRHKERTTAE